MNDWLRKYWDFVGGIICGILIFFLGMFVGSISHAQLTNTASQAFNDYNILGSFNPGFENGKVNWTASGGSFTITTTAANVGRGLDAAVFNASASAQTLSSKAVTIPPGLYSSDGEASCRFKTTASDYLLQVYDGTNVLGEITIQPSSVYLNQKAKFIFPASGTIQLRVKSQSNAADLYLDDCSMKPKQPDSMAQASFVGSALWPDVANCEWSNSAVTWSGYSADSDCTYPSGSNLKGTATAPGTKIPAVTFPKLEPGHYKLVVEAFFYQSSGGQSCSWRVHDGTQAWIGVLSSSSGASPSSGGQIVAEWDYSTTQTNVTIEVQEQSLGGGTCKISNDNSVANTGLFFTLYRWPLQNEEQLRPQDFWRVDANIGGANPDLGSSDQSSYIGIEDSGLDMVINPRSISAYIPCSSTNDSDGLTCSSGNESVGVAFVLPRMSDVKVCFSFAHEIATSGGAGALSSAFQVVRTGNTSQTILQEGNQRIASENLVDATTANQPHKVCGIFPSVPSGKNTFRLFYEQDATATVSSNVLLADRSSSLGQRDIHVEAYPLTEALPPIKKTVTTEYDGQDVITRAYLTNSGSCAISSNPGSWISSVSDPGAGRCSLTIATGVFNSAPICICGLVGSVAGSCSIESGATATALTTRVKDDAGSDLDQDFNIQCFGSKY